MPSIHDYVDQGLDAITPGHAPVSTGATLPPSRMRPWMVVAGAVGVLGLAAVARAAMERAIATVRGLPKFYEREDYAEELECEANRETMDLFLDSLPEEDRAAFEHDQSPYSWYHWSPEQQQMFADWVAHTNHPKAQLHGLQYRRDPYLNAERFPAGSHGDCVHVGLYNQDIKVRHLGEDGAPLARAMLDVYGYDAGKILPGKLRLEEIEGGRMVGWSPPKPEDAGWVRKGRKKQCARSPACRRWLEAPRVRLSVRGHWKPPTCAGAGPHETHAASRPHPLVACVTAHAGEGQKLPRKYTGPRGQCNLSEVYAVKGGARVPIDSGGLEAVEDAYDNPSVER